MKFYKKVLWVSFFVVLNFSFSARASSLEMSSQKFHQVLTTAGYSSALGAAVGLAVLGLSKNPQDNLSYVISGASIGFLSGAILGGVLSLYNNDSEYLDGEFVSSSDSDFNYDLTLTSSKTKKQDWLVLLPVLSLKENSPKVGLLMQVNFVI